MSHFDIFDEYLSFCDKVNGFVFEIYLFSAIGKTIHHNRSQPTSFY